MDTITVIIPTYNRFKYLLNAIESIKQQTYKNIKIIVVNDCSTQQEYYNYNWEENGITIIHLEENSKNKFGYASPGFVRNCGIKLANSKYIAFCDDDDIWFPKKIELQLNGIKETGCKISSTDGIIGNGIYNSTKKYKKFLAEQYYKTLQNIYIKKGSNLLKNGIPYIWNLDFLKIHNCVVCSSVLIEKKLLDKINNFKNMKPPGEDYDCWLRALQYTDNVYIKDVCFYYDLNHGDGCNY